MVLSLGDVGEVEPAAVGKRECIREMRFVRLCGLMRERSSSSSGSTHSNQQVVGNRANFEHLILTVTVLLTEIGRSVRSLWVTGCGPQARNQWSPAS